MARDRRVLPHNLDAEGSILGGVILRNDVLSQLDTLEVDDFYDHRHKVVFQAIRNLEATARPIDVVTLENEIEKAGKLDAIGGVAFLGELTLRVPTVDNVLAYAEIVTDKHQGRKLILGSSEIMEAGYEDNVEVRDYLDDAEAKIFEVTQRRDKTGPEPVKSLVKKVFSSLDERFKSPDGITGLPTGFGDLDVKTAGLQPTELIILAARPAMGKTSFAMSLAQNAATSGNWPVLVFSLEMSSTQLAERMLCSEAKVDSSALRRGQLVKQDMTNLTYAASALSKAPILIDDTPALSLRELRARARRFRSDPNLFPGEGIARARDQRDLARPQEPREGARLSGARAVAAQSRARATHRQATTAVGPARIRRDRAGQRRHPVHLSRRHLQQRDRASEYRRGDHRQESPRCDRDDRDPLRRSLHAIRES